MAALIGGEAVEHGAVGGLLQVEVEGGFDFEAGFVDLLGAEALFELAADFLLEPGSDGGVSGWEMCSPSGACGLLQPAA
jgi:hypothetical protein